MARETGEIVARKYLNAALSEFLEKIDLKPLNRKVQYFSKPIESGTDILESKIGLIQLWISKGYYPTYNANHLYVGVEIDEHTFRFSKKTIIHTLKFERKIWFDSYGSRYWFGIYQNSRESRSAFYEWAISFIRLVQKKSGRLEKSKDNYSKLDETEKEAIVKQRVQQSEFRNRVLSLYKYKCLISGVEAKDILIASHIREWFECKNHQEYRHNPYNGFPLLPTFDKLFDRHLITIDVDGKIRVSEKIRGLRKKLAIPTKSHTKPEIKSIEFIKFHNDKFKRINDHTSLKKKNAEAHYSA